MVSNSSWFVATNAARAVSWHEVFGTHSSAGRLFPGLSVLVLAAASFAQSAPDAFDALLKQGFELHQQARFSEALPVLERAHKLQPNNYFANLLLGIDTLRTGDPAGAIVWLRTAARIRPAEAIPEGYLGEAEARRGKYADAAMAYESAIARSHGSDDALEAWANFSLERFREIGASLRASDAGVAALERMQRSTPGSSARCGSISGLERQLAAKPAVGSTSAEVAARLSACYSIEAGWAAERLKTIAGDPAALDRLRGDILLRLKGDAAGAQEEYRKALALSPSDPGLLERLAEAQLAGGDTEGARASARAALQVNPHQHEAVRTLATIASNERDYAAALPLWEQLAQESPGDLSAQVELGRALVQSGNAAEALKHLAPALEAGYPDEKGALHALEARALRQLGRDAEAEKASAEARRRSDAFQARNKEGGRERPSDDH